MDKNICTMDIVASAAAVQGSPLKKAADLLVKAWFGADPGAPAFAADSKTARRPGPVLHRLPDLRKFGPNIV